MLPFPPQHDHAQLTPPPDREAGQAFERAASIQSQQLKEPDDMANTLAEAFKVYRKDSPEDAARVLSAAIQHYTLKGNFRRAATHQQNLAEVYEVEIGDQKKALEAYETAAGWFESDNAEALANKLFLKVADLAAIEGDYSKAVQQYERVARTSINSNLMKWSVKDYFLKAGICHLASAVRVPVSVEALDQHHSNIRSRIWLPPIEPWSSTETWTTPLLPHENICFSQTSHRP